MCNTICLTEYRLSFHLILSSLFFQFIRLSILYFIYGTKLRKLLNLNVPMECHLLKNKLEIEIVFSTISCSDGCAKWTNPQHGHLFAC